LDSSRLIVERLAAIEVLVDQAPKTAKLVMLSLGERVSEPREVLEAAGVGLARVDHSGVRISEFDLRDMSEVAFIAWANGGRPSRPRVRFHKRIVQAPDQVKGESRIAWLSKPFTFPSDPMDE